MMYIPCIKRYHNQSPTCITLLTESAVLTRPRTRIPPFPFYPLQESSRHYGVYTFPTKCY
jgi:hypothetical protein